MFRLIGCVLGHCVMPGWCVHMVALPQLLNQWWDVNDSCQSLTEDGVKKTFNRSCVLAVLKMPEARPLIDWVCHRRRDELLNCPIVICQFKKIRLSSCPFSHSDVSSHRLIRFKSIQFESNDVIKSILAPLLRINSKEVRIRVHYNVLRVWQSDSQGRPG